MISLVTCLFDKVDQEYLTDKKSLVVVIRDSDAIKAQIPNIINQINFTINTYWFNTQVYSNFILVMFGNNGKLLHSSGPNIFSRRNLS